MPRPELSLVIPIYNEEEVLPQLDVRLKELLDKLDIDAEVVFVNDGSRDKSIEILRRLASRETRYRVLGFSRNFGHQRAITAGMDKSRGRAVVVMDADLQDPPEVILEMVEKWKEGYDVVYGRRKSREGESWFKLTTAKIFYRLFAAMIPIEVPLDTGDFRLMSRRVVTTMRGLRETHRFVRGLVAWVGFKQTALEYDRAARAAGETKYPLRKMLAFAIDGIASFSIQPLRLATYVGVVVGAASVLYAIASTITYYAGMNVPGWTTTVVLVSFLFSVQFFMIGVLGEYVGRIYEQVKRRPLYIVSERINFGRRKTEKLITQDIEELETPLPSPVAPAAAGAGAGAAPAAAAAPAAGAGAFPLPPPAIVAAGAAAEAARPAFGGSAPTTDQSHAALSRPPPAVRTGRPPPVLPAPAGGTKPPPLKPSAGVTNVPVTSPKPMTPPPPRVAPSVPPPRVAPSVPPPAVTPAVKTTPSVPPPAVTPSMPPEKSTPSTPPAKTTPGKSASTPPKNAPTRNAKELFGTKGGGASEPPPSGASPQDASAKDAPDAAKVTPEKPEKNAKAKSAKAKDAPAKGAKTDDATAAKAEDDAD